MNTILRALDKQAAVDLGMSAIISSIAALPEAEQQTALANLQALPPAELAKKVRKAKASREGLKAVLAAPGAGTALGGAAWALKANQDLGALQQRFTDWRADTDKAFAASPLHPSNPASASLSGPDAEAAMSNVLDVYSKGAADLMQSRVGGVKIAPAALKAYDLYRLGGSLKDRLKVMHRGEKGETSAPATGSSQPDDALALLVHHGVYSNLSPTDTDQRLREVERHTYLNRVPLYAAKGTDAVMTGAKEQIAANPDIMDALNKKMDTSRYVPAREAVLADAAADPAKLAKAQQFFTNFDAARKAVVQQHMGKLVDGKVEASFPAAYQDATSRVISGLKTAMPWIAGGLGVAGALAGLAAWRYAQKKKRAETNPDEDDSGEQEKTAALMPADFLAAVRRTQPTKTAPAKAAPEVATPPAAPTLITPEDLIKNPVARALYQKRMQTQWNVETPNQPDRYIYADAPWADKAHTHKNYTVTDFGPGQVNDITLRDFVQSRPDVIAQHPEWGRDLATWQKMNAIKAQGGERALQAFLGDAQTPTQLFENPKNIDEISRYAYAQKYSRTNPQTAMQEARAINAGNAASQKQYVKKMKAAAPVTTKPAAVPTAQEPQ